MIYVTSDFHGEIDRFKAKEIKKLKKNDTLIILGDFGFVWDGSKKEQKVLNWIGKRRYNVLFIDGSHENFHILNQYATDEYCGGNAKQISGKLRYLCRGEIFNIENHSILCFGGAESVDKEQRQEGITWWVEELPTYQDFDNCTQNLKKYKGEVDYILTHDAPTRLSTFLHLDRENYYEKTPVETFFDVMYNEIKHKKWCFGRHHKDQKMGSKAAAVYKNVLPLTD